MDHPAPKKENYKSKSRYDQEPLLFAFCNFQIKGPEGQVIAGKQLHLQKLKRRDRHGSIAQTTQNSNRSRMADSNAADWGR